MARPATIASNATSLSIAVETTPGKVPSAPGTRWLVQEPNEYGDFGSEMSLTARRPINADRQRKKGTITGMSAMAGWNTDLTATNVETLLECFLFANARRKDRLAVTSVAADGYIVAAGGAAYPAGTLIAASGSDVPANNGLRVSTGGAAGKVSATGLAVSANGATIHRAGYQFAAGAASIDVTGPLPALVADGVNFPGLGLIPGEIVYLGGDDVANGFANPANRGWCRLLSVAVGKLVFDKTDAAMIADNGAGKSVRLFFGTVIKNEPEVLQVMRTLSARRTLSRPDSASPDIQSEVVTRCVANELTFNFDSEDKITCDVAFVAGDHVLFDDDSDIEGQLVYPDESDVFNTANDMPRVTMFAYPKAGNNSAPIPLFAAFENMAITVNNNVSENKALGYFGSYALTPGVFEVSGEATAYFTSIEGIKAVRDSADVTFMLALAKQNRGFAVDMPLIALGSSGADVSQDDPVMMDLDKQAASGKKYNAGMDHTLLLVLFPYLPDAAQD